MSTDRNKRPYLVRYKGNMHFIHYRPLSPQEGICIGYVLNAIKTKAELSVFVFEQGYCKRIGRQACFGRFEKGKFIDTEVDPDHIEKSVVNAAGEFLLRRQFETELLAAIKAVILEGEASE